jgi:hypothetical protein
MSMGGGGSGNSTAARTEIVQSEKEQLQEIERRMNLYDSLFGDIEKQTIQDGLGVLNPDRLTTHTTKLDDLTTREQEIESQMEADKATLMQYANFKEDDFNLPGLAGAANTAIGGISTDTVIGSVVGNIALPGIGSILGGAVGGLFGSKKKAKKIRAAVNAAKTRYEANANELIQLQQDRADTTQALQDELQTQQKNSKGEQTEQDRARATGVVDNAYALTQKTKDIRDAGYGIDPTANVRSAEELAKENALIKAAAEAGARNKAKTDVEALAKAKLGAITGAGLTDTAAANQLDALGKSYLSQSAAYSDLADQNAAQKDAATMQIISGIGSIAGTAVGTGYAKSTPDLTTTEQLSAINLGS